MRRSVWPASSATPSVGGVFVTEAFDRVVTCVVARGAHSWQEQAPDGLDGRLQGRSQIVSPTSADGCRTVQRGRRPDGWAERLERRWLDRFLVRCETLHADGLFFTGGKTVLLGYAVNSQRGSAVMVRDDASSIHHTIG